LWLHSVLVSLIPFHCQAGAHMMCTTDWSGCAGLFSGGLTPFTLPEFTMHKDN
jgi:hypothetical protein